MGVNADLDVCNVQRRRMPRSWPSKRRQACGIVRSAAFGGFDAAPHLGCGLEAELILLHFAVSTLLMQLSTRTDFKPCIGFICKLDGQGLLFSRVRQM